MRINIAQEVSVEECDAELSYLAKRTKAVYELRAIALVAGQMQQGPPAAEPAEANIEEVPPCVSN